MFSVNSETVREIQMNEMEILASQNVIAQVIRNLLSKLKHYLFSPCSISGMHFYLESEDES